MPRNPPPPDERPALPPLHQSLWFPVAPESGEKSSLDEAEAAPAPTPAAPAVNGLGWKAPRRVRVPIFERDAALENTTPSADAEENPVPTSAGRDNPQPQYVREFVLNGVSVDAPAAPRVPTANDETVRLLREHIVPGPIPPDWPDDEESATSIASAEAIEHSDGQEMIPPMTYDEMVRVFPGVLATVLPDDPDFQEVRRAPAPPEPETPRKGAEAAQAPACAVPVDRDDATPNDGVVPQCIYPGSNDTFCCALWSDGTFTIRPSDGEPTMLGKHDACALMRYVSEVLSARARAAA